MRALLFLPIASEQRDSGPGLPSVLIVPCSVTVLPQVYLFIYFGWGGEKDNLLFPLARTAEFGLQSGKKRAQTHTLPTFPCLLSRASTGGDSVSVHLPLSVFTELHAGRL